VVAPPVNRRKSPKSARLVDFFNKLLELASTKDDSETNRYGVSPILAEFLDTISMRLQNFSSGLYLTYIRPTIAPDVAAQ
jgi:hypothetical protein